MSTGNHQRSDITKLAQKAKLEASRRNKQIDTVDPIIRIGRSLFPTLAREELLRYSQRALLIILNESQGHGQQTTLFAHM